MKRQDLTRAIVRKNVQDADYVFVNPAKTYAPETNEHRALWPKLLTIIGETGAWYSTLRAVCSGNKDYVAYLVGDLNVLRIPRMDERLAIED